MGCLQELQRIEAQEKNQRGCAWLMFAFELGGVGAVSPLSVVLVGCARWGLS